MVLKIYYKKLVYAYERWVLTGKFHLPILAVFSTGSKTDRETNNKRWGTTAASELLEGHASLVQPQQSDISPLISS